MKLKNNKNYKGLPLLYVKKYTYTHIAVKKYIKVC